MTLPYVTCTPESFTRLKKDEKGSKCTSGHERQRSQDATSDASTRDPSSWLLTSRHRGICFGRICFVSSSFYRLRNHDIFSGRLYAADAYLAAEHAPGPLTFHVKAFAETLAPLQESEAWRLAAEALTQGALAPCRGMRGHHCNSFSAYHPITRSTRPPNKILNLSS